MRTIFHKLSYDALFLVLLLFSGLIFSEVIFPGFLAQFIPFTPVLIGIALLVVSIVFTRPSKSITQSRMQPSLWRNIILHTLLCLALLGLTALTLTSFSLWEQCIILLLLGGLYMSLVRICPMKNA